VIISLFDDYKPHPGQARFRASKARFKNILAGRRWGKDHAGAREFIRKIVVEDYPKIRHLKMPSDRFIKYSKPLLHYWAVAPDFNIGKIQQREVFSIFPPEFQGNKSHFDYNDNSKELRIFGNRVLIEFKSGDRPETLVGVGLNGVYATEFARFKESAWGANIRPTLTDKRGWGIFTSTPLPRQWYLEHVALGDPKSETYNVNFENFFGRTLDNVRLEGIAEEVELARKTLPQKYFKREYEASLEIFEGQVYEEWTESIHCPYPFRHPRFDLVIAGVDWGFAQPGCILVLGVVRTGSGWSFYVIDEVYEKGLLVDGEGDTWIKRAHKLKAKYGVRVFYCDTAEPANITAFRAKGLNAVSADKDVNDGIQAVATALHISGLTGLPSLSVDKSKVKVLPVQIVQYQFDKDEKPLKEKDHTCDTLRYAVHTFMKYGGVVGFQTSETFNDARQ